MKMKHISAAALASALLLAAGGASAQDNEDLVQMDIKVSAWAKEVLGERFDTKHRTLLKSAGLQMAVARSCDGFDIDKAKLNALLERAFEGHEEGDSDYDAVQASSMMALGAYMAMGLTAGAVNNDGLCAQAAEERAAKEGETDNIIWATSE